MQPSCEELARWLHRTVAASLPEASRLAAVSVFESDRIRTADLQDYVTGLGHGALGWPPSGGVVGQAVAGHGVAVAGGPGPGFHFPNGFAPGASFCNDQARSPGLHF